MNREAWERKYDEELDVAFQNTTEKEYPTFKDFVNDQWESYNESQFDEAISHHEETHSTGFLR